jgi:hypothetical protein
MGEAFVPMSLVNSGEAKHLAQLSKFTIIINMSLVINGKLPIEIGLSLTVDG